MIHNQMRDDAKEVEQTRVRWRRENKKRKDRYGDRCKALEIAEKDIGARGRRGI